MKNLAKIRLFILETSVGDRYWRRAVVPAADFERRVGRKERAPDCSDCREFTDSFLRITET